MSKMNDALAGAALALVLTGCTSTGTDFVRDAVTSLKNSFNEKGIVKLERLNQTPDQALCSEYADKDMPKAVAQGIEQRAMLAVLPPSDGKYLGDWKEGEKIAQNGRGLQFSDTEQTVNGGNCYACHQLTAKEMSYGNIGPSLLGYGKSRGTSEAILHYTWGKLWNSHAYNACSNMPKFGASKILTEKQLKDVMALLLSSDSPVNH